MKDLDPRPGSFELESRQRFFITIRLYSLGHGIKVTLCIGQSYSFSCTNTSIYLEKYFRSVSIWQQNKIRIIEMR